MTYTESIKALIDKSKDYLETKIELTRLKTIDKSADVLSTVVVTVSMLIVSFLLILFISLAIALFLGKMLGAYHYGFFYHGRILCHRLAGHLRQKGEVDQDSNCQ